MVRAIRDQARGFGNSRLIVALEVVAHRDVAAHERIDAQRGSSRMREQDRVTSFSGSAGEDQQPTLRVVCHGAVRVDR